MTTIMTAPHVTLPIFPLSVFILPQGITKLRIFEPRYLNMVSIAMKNNGFAIVPNINNINNETSTNQQDDNTSINDPIWGSWVNIINFDQNDDNTLMIEVQCRELVQVTAMQRSKNQLLFGDVLQQPHWSAQPTDNTIDKLTVSLKSIFEENHNLTNLYQGTFKHNANWVVARWLELLPVSNETKAAFYQANSFAEAKMFVAEIISHTN